MIKKVSYILEDSVISLSLTDGRVFERSRNAAHTAADVLEMRLVRCVNIS